MFCTLLSFLLLIPFAISGISLTELHIAMVMAFAGISLIFSLYLQQNALKAALKIDQKKLSGYLSLYRQQPLFKLLYWALLLLPLVQVALLFSSLAHFGLHLLFVGLYLDLCIKFTHYYLRALSDEGVLDIIVHSAEKCLKSKDQEGALIGCQRICQYASSAVHRGLFLTVAASYHALLKLFESMLAWAPLVMLFSGKDGRGGVELSLLERLQVLTGYVVKKAVAIIRIALSKQEIESAEEGVSFIAKMSCLLAQKHPELAYLPFAQLTLSLEQGGISGGIQDNSIDAHLALTISETVKSIVLDAHDIRSLSQQSLLQMVRILEKHMKGVLQRTPGMSMALILQPFAEIGQLLGTSALFQTGELELLRQELQRLFAQFVTLESLQVAPQGVGATSDSTSSFSQDMSFMGMPPNIAPEHSSG